MNTFRPQFGRRCAFTALAAVLLIAVAGCEDERTYPVQGKVSYSDGSPVTSGVVVFEAMDDPDKPTAVGPIRRDGTYRLETHQLGPGAVLGRHRVMLEPPSMGAAENAGPVAAFDSRFTRFDTSGLEFTVQPGENDYPITVEQPKRKSP